MSLIPRLESFRNMHLGRSVLLWMSPSRSIATALFLLSASGCAPRAEAKPASKEKCCFCEEPITGESFPGFTKKLKPRVACRQCTHNYVVARDQFARWCDTPRQAVEVKTRQGRAALRQRLSYCACGGKAEDHREDKDGNLLECSHCDGCDHFHYQTDEAESAKQAA